MEPNPLSDYIILQNIQQSSNEEEKKERKKPGTKKKAAQSENDQFQAVEFNITGFGKFGNVQVNPSDVLLGKLPEYLGQNPVENTILGEIGTVRVSIQDALSEVMKLKKIVLEKQKNHPERKQVVIHFGVYAGSNFFSLEQYGYNLADFANYPDEDGIKCSKERINKSYGIEHRMSTALNVNYLKFKLSKSISSEIKCSTDPGRYLCNFIYYVSLVEFFAMKVPVIFIHIPLFDKISLDNQLVFTRKFIEIVSKLELGKKKQKLLQNLN